MNRLWGKVRKLFWLIRHRRYAYLAYAIRNRLHGLDFGHVSVERLGLAPARSNVHSNSGGPELARIVRTLDISPGTAAVDLGSGKGGAALTLSRLGYERVVGVEIVEDLVVIARRNARRAKQHNVEFVCCDAGAFKELDSFAHVYMYNPFHEPIMTEVLTNLAESLVRTPRDLTLVYCNPQHHDMIIGSGIFSTSHEGDVLAINLLETEGSKFVVYTHHAGSSPRVDA